MSRPVLDAEPYISIDESGCQALVVGDETEELPPVQETWSNVGRYVADHLRKVRLVPKLASYQLQAELNDTRLGAFWLVLSPLLVALPSVAVFGYLLDVDRNVANYPLFAMIGLLSFRIQSRTWVRSARSFRPRGRPNVPAGVPASIGVSAHALQESVIGASGIAACTIWSVTAGSAPIERLPFTLLLIVLSFLSANGFGLIVAALSMRSADIAEAVPHAIRPLGFASGIWFLPSAFAAGTIFEPIFDWSPISVLLELFRVVLLGLEFRWLAVFSLVGSTVLANVVGVTFLWHTERHAR